VIPKTWHGADELALAILPAKSKLCRRGNCGRKHFTTISDLSTKVLI
jgi:hypothetical protein